MINIVKNAGGAYLSLFLVFLMGLFLLTPPLEARGSGEFSLAYQDALQASFEEAALKVESEEWTREQAKSALSNLRTQYRVDYNDFAGKIDALIDEVAENKRSSQNALGEFVLLQKNTIEKRNQTLREQEKMGQSTNAPENMKNENSPEQSGTGSGGGSSGNKK
jgi:hypothetical protein